MSTVVRFRLQGPDRDALAEALSAKLREDFEAAPELAPAREPDRPLTRSTGPVAVATLILTIPGAVWATVDLAERAKLVPKLRALIDWARARKASHPQSRVEIETADGRIMPLDEAEPAGLLRVHPERDGLR